MQWLLPHLPALLTGLAVLIALLATRGALRRLDRRVAALNRACRQPVIPMALHDQRDKACGTPMAEMRDELDQIYITLNEVIEHAEAARHDTATLWDRADQLARVTASGSRDPGYAPPLTVSMPDARPTTSAKTDRRGDLLEAPF